ncbi:polysaccharide biosynthesis protein [Alkalicoccus chagannorensis]|uniref:polysaccharide biosynthesis protein n=1 Tax=Alkalicoccus chagannorensis TaxID=427072 RepID=UPI00047E3E97|nr:nucleoside-diphosphate sugar epimerase/dehydratase [Alkalicoccus chagannorensis]
MKHRTRVMIFLLLDSVMMISAFLASFIIINEPGIYWTPSFWMTLAIILFSYHLISFLFELHRQSWEFASIGELKRILKALTASVALIALLHLLVFGFIQYRILFVTWLLMVLGVGGSRFWLRMLQSRSPFAQKGRRRTLIVGAGAAGTMIARQLIQNKDSELLPVAFADDDINKQRLDILSLPVAGGTEDIPGIVKRFRIEHIVIAIPSLRRDRLKHMYNACAQAPAKTQILPMIEDLATGQVEISHFRDVSVEDLLGREPVELDECGIQESITKKKVLITGAGGSIGSEICRQVLKFSPAEIILLGHGENSIYKIERELLHIAGETVVTTVIADVQDGERMQEVFLQKKPDVVYHAAAHKHVPLMERNPHEAVKNNTIGTLQTAEAAHHAGVAVFVMVSTDKAVNPTSVMGASKRLAEIMVHQMNRRSRTTFAVVRFGNVLGSSGSVIPLFREQIEAGGPVTVTHPDMERYFMTIPEASRLVIQAGTLAEGGETFVLDMGEPMKIVDLAVNMIRLSGHTADDIGIRYTGVRAGEKLYEELLNEEEIHDEQIFPKIYLGRPYFADTSNTAAFLQQFSTMTNDELREAIITLANDTAKADVYSYEA